MIGACLSAFGLIPRMWLLAGAAAIALALLAGAYVKGRVDSTAAWFGKDTARQLAEAKRRVALQSEVDTLNLELETARTQREVVTRTITREVPRYVREPAPQCADSGLHAPDFRVLYDAAALRTAPEPARVADAAPLPAVSTATAIVETIAGCHEAADQVEGWQRWWSAVSKPTE